MGSWLRSYRTTFQLAWYYKMFFVFQSNISHHIKFSWSFDVTIEAVYQIPVSFILFPSSIAKFLESVRSNFLASGQTKILQRRQLSSVKIIHGRSLFIFSTNNRFRLFCHTIVTFKHFDQIMLIIITLSSVILAMEDPLVVSSQHNDVSLLEIVLTARRAHCVQTTWWAHCVQTARRAHCVQNRVVIQVCCRVMEPCIQHIWRSENYWLYLDFLSAARCENFTFDVTALYGMLDFDHSRNESRVSSFFHREVNFYEVVFLCLPH